MKYTVVWTKEALNLLAAIWLDSDDREAITATVHRIDVLLARRPLEVGESREGSERIAFEWPLAIRFEVSEQDRKARVVYIYPLRPPGKRD